MSAPSLAANAWLDLLLKAAVRRASREALPPALRTSPLLGRIDLSTTAPQTTPPTENFQTEIATVVRVGGQAMVFSSGGGPTLQAVRATTPAAPALQARIAYGSVVPEGATVWVSQATASFGSLLAVALSPSNYATTAERGIVRFYRVQASGALTFLRDVVVGYLPDSIAFNSSGTRLVVANEGEPNANYSIDRPGSIGIIDIQGRVGAEVFSYKDLGFADISLPAGLRISGPPGTTAATDLEPEFVAILGNFAYVTLQENNGVAKVNLATRAIEKIFALGSVDLSTQLLDVTDQDGGIKPILGNNYVGLRMPDAIAPFTIYPSSNAFRGKDYFITANEGDGRDYVGYNDETRRPRLKTLKELTNQPYTAFGSRSISLFDADNGALLWDSGNTLQTLAIAARVYDDSRSDDKGVEPEGVVVARFNGRTYAVVGTERTTSTMLTVFDVSNPSAPSWVTNVVIAGSLSPEGLSFVEARQSTTGRAQLVVANEVSNTLDFLDFEALIASPAAAGAGSFAPTMIKDVAGGPDLTITSLLTVGETTNGLEPGSSVYVAPGIFDGMGVYDNGDNTFSLLVNHELGTTAGYQMNIQGLNPAVAGARISRFIVAKDIDNNAANGYQPKVLSGGLAYDKVVSADPAFAKGGLNRFCAANLAPAGQFSGRGFSDSLYLLGEETSNGRFFVLDPASRTLTHVAAFGLGSWESATLVDTGNADTVAALLFDDTTGAVLYLWVGQKVAGSADVLERNGIAASSGRLYAWKADGIAPTPEGLATVALSTPVGGSWVDLGSGTEVAALGTAAALRGLATAQGAMTFARIEDGDVNPLSGHQAVFSSTGGSGQDLYGGTYVIDLAASFGSDGQLLSGASTPLTVLVDTDRLTGLDRQNGVRNPDNVVWAGNGLIYLQEDRSLPSGTANGSFGAQEASIWEVDPLTGATSRWAQIDRPAVPTAYGQSDTLPSDVGNWETSGIVDVSPIYGDVPGSLFVANVQAHSLSGGNIGGSGYLVEGGQLLFLASTTL
jgi:Bacterial protein of unknown function (DUF839)/LVIVD repeat